MKCRIMYPSDFTKHELSNELDNYFGTTPEGHETVNIHFEAIISYTLNFNKMRTNLVVSVGGIEITDQLRDNFVEKIKVNMEIL